VLWEAKIVVHCLCDICVCCIYSALPQEHATLNRSCSAGAATSPMGGKAEARGAGAAEEAAAREKRKLGGQRMDVVGAWKVRKKNGRRRLSRT
jgi:hypothetical protein